MSIFQRSRAEYARRQEKGGLKVHAKIPLGGFVPDLVHLTSAACNDKSFRRLPNHPCSYSDGGTVADQWVLLNPEGSALGARLIIYREPQSGQLLGFVSNMFDYQDSTIVRLAAVNMGSYLSLIKILKPGRLTETDRELKIIQLDLFAILQGGVLQSGGKSP